MIVDSCRLFYPMTTALTKEKIWRNSTCAPRFSISPPLDVRAYLLVHQKPIPALHDSSFGVCSSHLCIAYDEFCESHELVGEWRPLVASLGKERDVLRPALERVKDVEASFVLCDKVERLWALSGWASSCSLVISSAFR